MARSQAYPYISIRCRAEHPEVCDWKNWVIIDSVNGAEASAGIYSLVETAKANGLRPYFYIRYVLSVMKEHADEVFGQNDAYIENLLPWSGQLPEECHQQPDPSTTTA